MATRVLLLRHGQSTWNAEGRWQGWSDPPLSELGRTQAADAARHLQGFGLTSLASSDLERARTTAAIVARGLGIAPLAIEGDLREYNVGEWEGLTRPEIEAGWPDQLADWRQGRLAATPGGETRVAFLARVEAGLARVVGRSGAGDCPLVITHGGVIRALEQLAEGRRSAVIDNLAGRWFRVDADGGAVRLHAGDVVAGLDPDLRTASPSL